MISQLPSPQQQYATGLTRANIERALAAAGQSPDTLEQADLAEFEDFHSLGRIATAALVQLAAVTAEDRTLDAGTGIGGTARMLAAEIGCSVTAVDLTPEYCDTARWLNGAVGLSERIEVIEADVCELPCASGSFDVVISQHVQMNIADKARLYAEARRVLAPAGRLALWDVTAGPEQPIHFPVPWANTSELSHLVTPDELRLLVEAAGFEVATWNDLTEFGVTAMTRFFAAPPNPLGLQVFVPDFVAKATNLVHNAQQNRIRLIQALLVAC
jgi:sarcosine/dimethylglycine N-methyltransferase